MPLPNRKIIRAQRHDYRSEGFYFVTICCKNRENYFGKIIDGVMILSEIGMVCDDKIIKLNNRKTVNINEWVVMPNHVHLLVRIKNTSRRDASLMRPVLECIQDGLEGCVQDGFLNRPYEGPSLGSIVKLLKGNVTKHAKQNDITFARQSRYHDHIIRNEFEYERIKNYIKNNPKKWSEDRFYV